MNHSITIDLPDHPFTLRELERLGIDRPAFRRALGVGDILSVVRGVFRAAHVDDTIDVRAAAVAKVAQPHHVVIDRTAAWLHDVDLYVYAEHDGLPILEVCALRGHEPTHLTGVDGRSRDLAPEDVMELHGLRVTTPLRTALDLGCCLEQRDAFAALTILARKHGLTRRDYERALPRYRRRRGVVQLRDLVPLVDPRIESIREAWVFLELRNAGLPLPEPQHWIVIDGVPTYRLDFAYVRRRVCVEYDGFEAHEKTVEQHEDDEQRREWLRRNGWTVIVVRRGDFTGAARDRWLRQVEAALAPAYSNRRW